MMNFRVGLLWAQRFYSKYGPSNKLAQLVNTITGIWISDEEVIQAKKKLSTRYATAITISGTRDFHSYTQLSSTTISVSLMSKDESLEEVRVASKEDSAEGP